MRLSPFFCSDGSLMFQQSLACLQFLETLEFAPLFRNFMRYRLRFEATIPMG